MRAEKWWKIMLAATFLFLCCGIMFFIGGAIVVHYNISGIWSHILSGLIGMLIFGVIARIITIFHIDKNHVHMMLDPFLDAIERISQGDFNVFIDPKKDERYADFAIAINQMAQDLGSMEQLRQDFISNVSHEFQSPLTSILGFATLLKTCNENYITPQVKYRQIMRQRIRRSTSLSSLTYASMPASSALYSGKFSLANSPIFHLQSDRIRYIEIIENEAKRLSSLSSNLLKLSSLENAEIEHKEFRLDKQIEQIVLSLEPQWRAKNINIDVGLEKTTYNGDEDLLAQVWINLLHNAIKFTKDNIKITLKDNVFTIEDNGGGIAEQDKIHIFERFYKADKARDRSLGGNGLGLALVKKIVELHGGDIFFESEIGKGTKFTVFYFNNRPII